MPSTPGSIRSSRTSRGPFSLEEAGHLLRIARHERGVARRGKHLPNVAERQRVVVDHQDARRLRLKAPGRRLDDPVGFVADRTGVRRRAS